MKAILDIAAFAGAVLLIALAARMLVGIFMVLAGVFLKISGLEDSGGVKIDKRLVEATRQERRAAGSLVR